MESKGKYNLKRLYLVHFKQALHCLPLKTTKNKSTVGILLCLHSVPFGQSNNGAAEYKQLT